jgi:hypothetical protein
MEAPTLAEVVKAGLRQPSMWISGSSEIPVGESSGGQDHP